MHNNTKCSQCLDLEDSISSELAILHLVHHYLTELTNQAIANKAPLTLTYKQMDYLLMSMGKGIEAIEGGFKQES